MLFIAIAIAIPGYLLFEPLGALGYPATIVAASTPLLYVLARLLPGYLADGFQPMRLALLALAVAGLVSYAAGLVRALSPVETTSSIRALITYLSFIGLGLLVVDGVRDRRHLDRLLGFIVLGATVLAVLGIVQFFTGVNPDQYIHVPGLVLQDQDITVDRSMFTRVQGTALHPIEFGVVLALALPVAVHYAMHGIAGRPPSRWRWLPVLLLLVATPMSVSRSSILGITVGMAFLALTWSWRTRLKALWLGLLLAVAMRAAFPGLLGTVRGMFTSVDEDPSIEGRTKDYPIIAEMFEQDPWLGRGIGTFIPIEHFFVDNQYLMTVVTGGLVGLVSLLAVFVVAISLGRGVFHHAEDPAARSLGMALAAASVVSLATWATYDGLAFRVNAGNAFIIFGALGALWRLEVGRLHWGRDIRKSRPEPAHVGVQVAPEGTEPTVPESERPRPQRVGSPS